MIKIYPILSIHLHINTSLYYVFYLSVLTNIKFPNFVSGWIWLLHPFSCKFFPPSGWMWQCGNLNAATPGKPCSQNIGMQTVTNDYYLFGWQPHISHCLKKCSGQRLFGWTEGWNIETMRPKFDAIATFPIGEDKKLQSS